MTTVLHSAQKPLQFAAVEKRRQKKGYRPNREIIEKIVGKISFYSNLPQGTKIIHLGDSTQVAASSEGGESNQQLPCWEHIMYEGSKIICAICPGRAQGVSVAKDVGRTAEIQSYEAIRTLIDEEGVWFVVIPNSNCALAGGSKAQRTKATQFQREGSIMQSLLIEPATETSLLLERLGHPDCYAHVTRTRDLGAALPMKRKDWSDTAHISDLGLDSFLTSDVLPCLKPNQNYVVWADGVNAEPTATQSLTSVARQVACLQAMRTVKEMKICLAQAILLNDQPWTWSLTEAFLGLIVEMRNGRKGSATIINEDPSQKMGETKEEISNTTKAAVKKGNNSIKIGTTDASMKEPRAPDEQLPETIAHIQGEAKELKANTMAYYDAAMAKLVKENPSWIKARGSKVEMSKSKKHQSYRTWLD